MAKAHPWLTTVTKEEKHKNNSLSLERVYNVSTHAFFTLHQHLTILLAITAGADVKQATYSRATRFPGKPTEARSSKVATSPDVGVAEIPAAEQSWHGRAAETKSCFCIQLYIMIDTVLWSRRLVALHEAKHHLEPRSRRGCEIKPHCDKELASMSQSGLHQCEQVE